MTEKLRPPPSLWIALVAVISLIPLFSIPIAPITDWPTHLAIASQVYHLQINPAINHNYYVDFSFLGYSLIYIILAFLRQWVSIALAGQIVLALAYLIVPAGWWFFFRTLEPEKISWAAAGILLNYSTYFYFGNINYLLSVPFGLAYMAVGIGGLRTGRERPLLLAVFALLTFLAHAYVFFLLSVLMLGLAFYHSVYRAERGKPYTMALLFTMLSLAAIHTAINPVKTFDQTYFSRVIHCASLETTPADYSPNQALSGIAVEMFHAVSRLIEPFYSLAFFLQMAIAATLAALAYMAYQMNRFISGAKPLKELLAEHAPGFALRVDRYYLALAAILLLHAAVMPDCVAWLCNLGGRSLPFAYAFILLAVRPKEIIAPLAWIMLAWAIINVATQYAMFAQEAPIQAQIMQQTEQLGAQLAERATVFVVPSAHTSVRNWTLQPPYANPYYQALIVDKRPDIYVAGLYTSQQTNPLRSHLRIFDEMAHFGPHPSMTANDTTPCYYPVPSAYEYIIDENMQLRKNN